MLWYEQTLTNPYMYVADYVKLYADTVYEVVGKLDPDRPWADSSPSNGLVSKEPYVKRWGDPYSSIYGDTHYYDYQKDCEDPGNFPE